MITQDTVQSLIPVTSVRLFYSAVEVVSRCIHTLSLYESYQVHNTHAHLKAIQYKTRQEWKGGEGTGHGKGDSYLDGRNTCVQSAETRFEPGTSH